MFYFHKLLSKLGNENLLRADLFHLIMKVPRLVLMKPNREFGTPKLSQQL